MSRPLVFLLAVILLAANSSICLAEGFDSLYYDELGWVAPFQMADQEGRPVQLEDLRGKIWVASFFYSTCVECNKYTLGNLKDLQRDLSGYPDVRIVSFSVFPERDTIEELSHFAGQFQVDSRHWLLLRGPKEQTYELIEKSFRQAVGPNSQPEPGREILHSFKFMIVDQYGKIRGYVDGRDPQQLARLEQRVKELVQAKYLPSINAGLNGLSGLLILVGFLAIRRRWITFHKVCMLSALVVSALFLCCYLYYHFTLLHGQVTQFGGLGWVRPAYFGILLSHTVLAVVVAPLALTTTYLGLCNRLAWHVTLARWTLPLWLYVSATGVLVYWMLYHLYPPTGY